MNVINEYIRDLVDEFDTDDGVKFKKMEYKHGRYVVTLEYVNKTMGKYYYLCLMPAYIAKYNMFLKTYLENFQVIIQYRT